MICRKCKKRKAVINIKAYRLPLCDECYPGWFIERTKKVIKEFSLLKKEDRILTAVSGGKDSLSLWHTLSKIGYNADGLYIHLGIEGYSDRSLEKCRIASEKLNRRLIVYNLKEKTGKSIPEIKDLRSKCSTCGLAKRYIMNRTALEEGYNVVATGHNLDDECASLLSTALRWDLGYFGRQDINLPEMKGFVRKVKPFAFFSEKEVLTFALLQRIDYLDEECPYAEGATSILYKEVLNIIENRSPGTKIRFYREFLLKKKEFEKFRELEELRECSICGQLTTREICAFCKTFGKLENRSY
jgi:uncharacterized protein (TIGR00269 family)